jgi:hypothetical protein
MTKWSALPRVFGTVPAGSFVRVKSRLRLYSTRAPERGADFFATFVRVVVFLGTALFFAEGDFVLGARFAAGRFTARLVVFFVGMRAPFAKTMPAPPAEVQVRNSCSSEWK